ncbi:MAG: outer membrane protein assembly factor BamE [Bdellovibrionaceae bacterium]|nr:outer membrane protein assembly factor BamE [Pseudobdellovibrionaceae bacterium]
MQIERPLVVSLVFLLTSSCSVFQRSNASGYADGPQLRRASTSSPLTKELYSASHELGIDPSSPLSPDDRARIELRHELRTLERSLETRQEKEQYSKILPWFNDDKEKIQFLRIQSLQGRENWIRRSGILQRMNQVDPEMEKIVNEGDIAIGMTTELVRRAWGDPTTVEVSGNPIYRNERWKYIRNVPSSEGYRTEKRIVYFEAGRVVGWDTL